MHSRFKHSILIGQRHAWSFWGVNLISIRCPKEKGHGWSGPFLKFLALARWNVRPYIPITAKLVRLQQISLVEVSFQPFGTAHRSKLLLCSVHDAYEDLLCTILLAWNAENGWSKEKHSMLYLQNSGFYATNLPCLIHQYVVPPADLISQSNPSQPRAEIFTRSKAY